jgi:hypothetical protein
MTGARGAVVDDGRVGSLLHAFTSSAVRTSAVRITECFALIADLLKLESMAVPRQGLALGRLRDLHSPGA